MQKGLVMKWLVTFSDWIVLQRQEGKAAPHSASVSPIIRWMQQFPGVRYQTDLPISGCVWSTSYFQSFLPESALSSVLCFSLASASQHFIPTIALKWELTNSLTAVSLVSASAPGPRPETPRPAVLQLTEINEIWDTSLTPHYMVVPNNVLQLQRWKLAKYTGRPNNRWWWQRGQRNTLNRGCPQEGNCSLRGFCNWLSERFKNIE